MKLKSLSWVLPLLGLVLLFVRDVIVSVTAEEVKASGGFALVGEIAKAGLRSLQNPMLFVPALIFLGIALTLAFNWLARKWKPAPSENSSLLFGAGYYAKEALKDEMKRMEIELEQLIHDAEENRNWHGIDRAARKISNKQFEYESFLLKLKKFGFTVPMHHVTEYRDAVYLHKYLRTINPFLQDHFEDALERSKLATEAVKKAIANLNA